MIESFISDALTGLAVMGAVVIGAIYAIAAIAVYLAKRVHRDCQEQGGAKRVATKMVVGTAAKAAGQALRKRFLG